MNEIVVTAKELEEYCQAILQEILPDHEAEVISKTLVDANLLGVHSHGVSRLTDYLKRLEDGLIANETHISLINETSTTALYNAHNGWGQVVSEHAMQQAIDKALKYGTGFVGVRNSNHFGTASYYTRMAAEYGCIGIAMTNASPIMVPFGSKEPSLGTNPLSIAVPAGDNKDPVLLDMATSTVARGKITLAKKNNELIPDNWAINADGEPTNDPVKALEGFVLPFGAKGSGLAIIIDILTGVLTGSLFGKKIPRMYEDAEPQQLGHLFGAINIEGFIGKEEFYEKVQEKINETVNSVPMEGFDRVYMPGEIELSRKKRYEKEGIPLTVEIYNELKDTGQKYSVDIKQYIFSGIKEPS